MPNPRKTVDNVSGHLGIGWQFISEMKSENTVDALVFAEGTYMKLFITAMLFALIAARLTLAADSLEEIDDLLAKGHYRIHELISPDITVTGDTASTRSFFQTTDNDNGRIYAVSIGVYKGQMVRGADGKWRIKEWLLIRQGGANPTGAPR